MHTMKRIISILLLSSITAAGFAQENISFENNDCKAVSTYDQWKDSPFNTGKLEGQVAVIDNPYVEEQTNNSAKVLAFNRSRYGSHLYGAKVELNSPVRLSKEPVYLHVMVRSPQSGKITILALGKRHGWNSQSNSTFQIARTSLENVTADKWTDAVFKLTGNEEAEIHSLVLVPDNKSMTEKDKDYVVYFDEIMLSNDDTPRFQTEGSSTESNHEMKHPETVSIAFNSRMCNISAVNGGPVPETIPFGKDYTFNIQMDDDYVITGLKIKHGFNLSGEQFINKRQQWKEDTINLSKDGKITIPAKYIDGDINIEVLFTNRPR